MTETVPVITLSPRDYDAVLFDLDGVLTQTARVHAAAWKKLFDGFLESEHDSPNRYELSKQADVDDGGGGASRRDGRGRQSGRACLDRYRGDEVYDFVSGSTGVFTLG
ncbi:MAG: HAD family hydrolase [Gammaproteobacteria bacterium]